MLVNSEAAIAALCLALGTVLRASLAIGGFSMPGGCEVDSVNNIWRCHVGRPTSHVVHYSCRHQLQGCVGERVDGLVEKPGSLVWHASTDRQNVVNGSHAPQCFGSNPVGSAG